MIDWGGVDKPVLRKEDLLGFKILNIPLFNPPVLWQWKWALFLLLQVIIILMVGFSLFIHGYLLNDEEVSYFYFNMSGRRGTVLYIIKAGDKSKKRLSVWWWNRRILMKHLFWWDFSTDRESYRAAFHLWVFCHNSDPHHLWWTWCQEREDVGTNSSK